MSDRVIKKILVPVELVEDFSPDADYAIQLAAQLRADLILVAVVDTSAAASMIAHHQVEHGRRVGFNEILVKEAKLILQGIVDQAAEVGVDPLRLAEHRAEKVDPVDDRKRDKVQPIRVVDFK